MSLRHGVILWILAACLVAHPGGAVQAGSWERFEIEATDSYATWYFPRSADADQPVPLVVFLHGSGGTPEVYQNFVRVAAELAGCALLLPKSQESLGWGFGPDPLTLREGLRLIRERFRVDEKRVAIAGHSAGGAYAFQMAFLQPFRFSGVFAMASPFTSIPRVLDRDHQAPLRMYYGDQDPNFVTAYTRLREQWSRLGFNWEEEIGVGFGHRDLPLDPIRAGFEFLVDQEHPTASPAPCDLTNRPAATLLIPFFEVQPEDPSGLTTLFSINNALSEPVLSRVVLWTDCGLPVLGFDLYLSPEEVRTLNLRDVLVSGLIPRSGENPTLDFPGCSRPLIVPTLDEGDLLRLRQQLTGLPSTNGLCYASHQAPKDRLTGYVTVDVVNRCSEGFTFPDDAEYFLPGGSGVASNRNALWGDIFYVAPSQNNAQGSAAVAIRADESRFQGGRIPSFYGQGFDERMPLSSSFRSRFLNGGAFDGGTGLILWTSGRSEGPFSCGLACPGSERSVARFRFRNEAATTSQEVEFRPGRFSMRVDLGSEALPVEEAFGSLDLQWIEEPSSTDPSSILRRQAVVVPIFSAEERFSIGLDAMAVDDLCRDGVLISP